MKSTIYLVEMMVTKTQELSLSRNQGTESRGNKQHPVLLIPPSHLLHHLQSCAILGDRVELEENHG